MRLLGLLTVWCVLWTAACAQDPAAPAAKATDDQNTSAVAGYGIGMNIGRSLKNESLDVDVESLIQGLRDGLQGATAKYPEDRIRMALEFAQHDAQAKHEQRAHVAGEKNLRDAQAFLAANKEKKGVVTLASGLQYQVLHEGNGPSPKASDTVKVHYEGTLLDGTVFDSSIKRKTPAEFRVGGVIPGWVEALQKMKVGDRWRLFLPPSLAYGAQGAGGVIGPNSLLIFDVELLAIQPHAAE